MSGKAPCGFCDELQGHWKAMPPKHKTLLQAEQYFIVKSENHVLVPSLGPLSNLHALMVTSAHVGSVAESGTSTWRSMRGTYLRLREAALREYGRTLVMFEHGAGRLGDTSGACVWHAHMHCIDVDSEFCGSFARDAGLVALQPNDSVLEIADVDKGYLFLMNGEDEGWLLNNPHAPQQYFRRFFSAHHRVSVHWNWRTDPRYTDMVEVVSKYVRLGVVT